MIRFSLHIRDKLKLLERMEIVRRDVEEALEYSNLKFFNALQDLHVVVKKLSEDEVLIVVYEEEEQIYSYS